MREWSKCELGDALTLQRGFDLPSQSRLEGKIPIVSSSGITDFHSEYKVEGPGVITGRYGTIGEVFYLKENFWPLNTALYVKDFKGNDKRFCAYLLSNLDIKGLNAAGAVPGVNRNHLHKIKIKYPPLPQQKQIASILSAYDDFIENNLKRIKLLEELAQRTYEEWFVKFRVNGVQLEVGENGLPEGWESIKIDQLLDKVQPSGKTLSTEICSVGKYPVIDQSRDFIAGYIDNEERLVKSERPVIVFGDHTRILKFVNFPFVRGADGTQVILSKEERMPQHLFYHALLRVDLSNYHYARHFKFLKDCEVVVPSRKVAQLFETIVTPKFDIIRNLRNQNRVLKESRDILLPRLMNGKIEVGGDEFLGMVAEEREEYK